jgi:ferredoxin
MYELRLNSKQCICCGICMDVCRPAAIRMRFWRGKRVEGDSIPVEAMSFPYLARVERCDGCMECAKQCPVSALTIWTLPKLAARSLPCGEVATPR